MLAVGLRWTIEKVCVRRLRVTRAFVIVFCVAISACSSSQDVPPSDHDSGPDITGPTRALAASDVSVLFPLQDSALSSLLTPDLEGRGGALFPYSVFEQIPEHEPLTNAIHGYEETYEALRVVAFRYDPCFMGQWGGVPCQPQIRLTMQPIVVGEDDNTVVAADGAVHLMYNLHAQDDAAVYERLVTLTAAAPENDVDTLSVSPTLLADGLDGSYGIALRALILEYCGPDTLARMTFTTRTLARQGTWHFGGFNVQSFPDTTGLEGPLEIFGIHSLVQSVSNAAFASQPISYTVAPQFGDEAGRVGTSDEELATLSADGETVAELRTWFQNQTNGGSPPIAADSTDCASCHLAPHIQRAAEARFGATSFEYGHTVPFESGTSDDNLDNMRAFAYFEAEPVITPRVAHETAAVLAFLAER